MSHPSPKKAAKKKAARKAAKKPSLPRAPAGYGVTESGFFVPSGNLVPAGKLAKGLRAARQQIQKLLQEIVDTSTQDFEISEIEIAASFNADGKFMGFGVGGEATVTIRIRPSST